MSTSTTTTSVADPGVRLRAILHTTLNAARSLEDDLDHATGELDGAREPDAPTPYFDRVCLLREQVPELLVELDKFLAERGEGPLTAIEREAVVHALADRVDVASHVAWGLFPEHDQWRDLVAAQTPPGLVPPRSWVDGGRREPYPHLRAA